MNGGLAAASQLAQEVSQATAGLGAVDVAVLPPFVHLQAAGEALKGGEVALGAQDLDHREQGAVTGAVAGEMLRDLGCVYVLVGHSERRQLFGEDDALVAQKFQRALAVGLAPILCLGETLEVREAGGALDFVGAQLQAALDAVGAAGLAQGVIAYEPVWAIGAGKSASPAEIAEMHGFLRRRLAQEGIDKQVRVLYGGSVNVDNAPELFALEDVDGALVGGASLDAQRFAKICAAAEDAASA